MSIDRKESGVPVTERDVLDEIWLMLFYKQIGLNIESLEKLKYNDFKKDVHHAKRR